MKPWSNDSPNQLMCTCTLVLALIEFKLSVTSTIPKLTSQLNAGTVQMYMDVLLVILAAHGRQYVLKLKTCECKPLMTAYSVHLCFTHPPDPRICTNLYFQAYVYFLFLGFISQFQVQGFGCRGDAFFQKMLLFKRMLKIACVASHTCTGSSRSLNLTMRDSTMNFSQLFCNLLSCCIAFVRVATHSISRCTPVQAKNCLCCQSLV